MRKKRRNVKETIIATLIITIPLLILGGLIATEIYVWTTYGGKSMSEIPLWALFFMFGRK